MLSAETHGVVWLIEQLGWCLFVVYGTTIVLRKNHAREIYLIWYYNSFFFLIFFSMGVIAELKGTQPAEVCKPYEAICKSLHSMLTDVADEFILLGVLVGLSIGPQLLTYFLSGVSGTASAPKYMRQIQTIAVWSLVKFFAGFGGILTAHPLAKFATRRPLAPNDVEDLNVGLFITVLAFTWAAGYVLITENLPALLRWCFTHFRPSRTPYRALIQLHRFFTRHARS
jgi:hypothetical protein